MDAQLCVRMLCVKQRPCLICCAPSCHKRAACRNGDHICIAMAAGLIVPIQIHSGRDLHSRHFFVLRHHFIEFFIGEINAFIAGLSVDLEKDRQKLDIPALGVLYGDVAARIGDDADFIHIESFLSVWPAVTPQPGGYSSQQYCVRFPSHCKSGKSHCLSAS